MSLDGPRLRPIGSLDNRLTFAEVRRALFRTTEGFFLFFGAFFGGIPLALASFLVVSAARDDIDGPPLHWVLPFLSLFIAVGGTLFVVGARKLRRRLRVYRSGLPAWGNNLGIREDPSMKVNDRPCRLLEFEYVDLKGATHVCRSSYLSADMIARLESLETVPVVYVSDRPDEADLDLDRL